MLSVLTGSATVIEFAVDVVVAGQTLGNVTTGCCVFGASLRPVLVRNARARGFGVETFLVFTRLLCLELNFILILKNYRCDATRSADSSQPPPRAFISCTLAMSRWPANCA